VRDPDRRAAHPCPARAGAAQSTTPHASRISAVHTRALAGGGVRKRAVPAAGPAAAAAVGPVTSAAAGRHGGWQVSVCASHHGSGQAAGRFRTAQAGRGCRGAASPARHPARALRERAASGGREGNSCSPAGVEGRRRHDAAGRQAGTATSGGRGGTGSGRRSQLLWEEKRRSAWGRSTARRDTGQLGAAPNAETPCVPVCRPQSHI
jgi:hypothetical protein